MKQLIILAVILGGGFLAWKYFPALQTKANETIANLTAWDEKDIKDRPVEYIDWAKGQLEDNIDKFEAALAKSDENHQDNVKQLERFVEQERDGKEATKAMRELYNVTEETGSWPVTFNGTEYSKEGFRAQMLRYLGDTKNAAKQAAEYEKLVDGGRDQKLQIQNKIAELQRAITDLEVQRSGIETAKLTEDSEAILLSVNEIVGTSTKVAKSDDILSLEEYSLAKAEAEAEAAKKAASEAAESELDAFLEGDA